MLNHIKRPLHCLIVRVFQNFQNTETFIAVKVLKEKSGEDLKEDFMREVEMNFITVLIGQTLHTVIIIIYIFIILYS